MDSHESDKRPALPAGAAGTASVGRRGQSRASKCPCCGHYAVRPKAQTGRTYRYRNTALTLPADLQVPTCGRCKHVVLSFESLPELDATLEMTYRAELTRRGATEIARLSRACSQRKIEVILNLSQGYLSRLRAGEGVPSAALVSLMALLSAEPLRLEELKRYWALPVATQSRAGARKVGA